MAMGCAWETNPGAVHFTEIASHNPTAMANSAVNRKLVPSDMEGADKEARAIPKNKQPMTSPVAILVRFTPEIRKTDPIGAIRKG